MSDLIFISKDIGFSQRSRTNSVCARCCGGNRRESSQSRRRPRLNSGRERELSLEIDGREGRSTRRRHASISNDGGRRSPKHCFITSQEKVESPKASSTTYSEDFQSPREHSHSQASSPISPTPRAFLSSPASRGNYSARQQFPPVSHTGTPRLNSISRNGSTNANTTYRQHFTWMN